MTKKSVTVLCLSLQILSASFLNSVFGQSIKLNVASYGISHTKMPPYVSQEAGLYKKNGLDVSIIRTRSDVAVMSMIAGDTAMIHAAGPTIIRSNITGADG